MAAATPPPSPPPAPPFTDALLLHNCNAFGPILWNLSPQLVSTIAQQQQSIYNNNNSAHELKNFDRLLYSGDWTEINFIHCQAFLNCALWYITSRIMAAQSHSESAQAQRRSLRWRTIKQVTYSHPPLDTWGLAVSVQINPYLERQKLTYYDPHASYVDERPPQSDVSDRLPTYITALLVQLTPLHYASLDCREMTRMQEDILSLNITSPGIPRRIEVRLLRLVCSDSVGKMLIWHVDPATLHGLQIDTGLDGAVYLHATKRLGQTLRRLAIRLTSTDVDIEDPIEPDEYDRAFFPITSGTLSNILDKFPNLSWLTVDVATSIEELFVQDLGDRTISREHDMHPKLEATVPRIAEVLNRSPSLQRLALTWRGKRVDFLMGLKQHTAHRLANFERLIQALGRACPQLHRIAFVIETMLYYSGLRQEDGSMVVLPKCAALNRPGEWPLGLRGSRDYFEVAHEQAEDGDGAKSGDVVVQGGSSSVHNGVSDGGAGGSINGASNGAVSRISNGASNGAPNEAMNQMTNRDFDWAMDQISDEASTEGQLSPQAPAHLRLVAMKETLGQEPAKGMFDIQPYDEDVVKTLYSDKHRCECAEEELMSTPKSIRKPCVRKRSDTAKPKNMTNSEHEDVNMVEDQGWIEDRFCSTTDWLSD